MVSINSPSRDRLREGEIGAAIEIPPIVGSALQSSVVECFGLPEIAIALAREMWGHDIVSPHPCF